MLIRFLLPFLFSFLISPLLRAAEPLAPEQAFQFSAVAVDARIIEARWLIADGYYLYRDRFKFRLEPESARLGAAEFPPGEMKDDPGFGKVEVYHRQVVVRLPVENVSGPVTLKAVSQGCADMGICYPPQNHEALLDLASAGQAPGLSPAPAPVSESSRIARLLSHGSYWLVLSSFFGFGLLLAFTPCVLPMVPILSGIIVNHGHAVTHGRAFALSLVYVLGMALTYALAGVAAGYTGTLLSSALQNAWVLGSFALVFVALSLSMFGFYELQLPSALQSRLSDTANRRGGSLPALFIMGVLSALIVGPCVAAPLAGALLYIAQTGNAALGGGALFTMALGMGVPLLAVGLFSRSLLPRTGPWMEAVKKFFGVVLLATALWLVSPVLPAWLVMLGWAALLIVPAIYLHALDPLPPQARGWPRFWKGLGVLLLLAGSALVIGVLGGARDPLQPLSFLRGVGISQGTSDHSPRFIPVRSRVELDGLLKNADRPVMLDFYADWCVSCKEMERNTFSDPAVRARMDRMLLLQADVTANSDEDKALLARFDFFGPPGIAFFPRPGQERKDLRVTGYQGPVEFLATLEAVLKE
ncbi:protein-disulfide reductase DsbD [Denitratisoma oestradiolicum]|uniref:Thiol:disulfide interchange protein DsbD n=1 Tax=Denitratisoma oestradiolicum TaxID=311182 RepID=A0A6S6XY53_9PROT|nr:protein-disulfide reductase DsbD [Denitratisoma oestradiolicum]TWO80766.1 thiol:disulfide interchange protein [Denitratisoma oestradiolicum]CAB1370924.1 Thiol:disulfide interchange protein: activator of DsbC [Denitratisoma oestradiolicum]